MSTPFSSSFHLVPFLSTLLSWPTLVFFRAWRYYRGFLCFKRRWWLRSFFVFKQREKISNSIKKYKKIIIEMKCSHGFSTCVIMKYIHLLIHQKPIYLLVLVFNFAPLSNYLLFHKKAHHFKKIQSPSFFLKNVFPGYLFLLLLRYMDDAFHLYWFWFHPRFNI